MKKWIVYVSLIPVLLLCLWTAKGVAEFAAEKTLARHAMVAAALPEETTLPETTVPETTALPETQPTAVPTTEAVTEAPETTAETTQPVLLTFTEEEETLLLKIGMAERGDTYCPTCIALVMRTVLNRVESPKFPSTVKGVIYAENQFTPVAEGTFEDVKPNDVCRMALKSVKEGWDDSQGALYYEWCEGPSWHSQNLNLLLQHCDTRFYN